MVLNYKQLKLSFCYRENDPTWQGLWQTVNISIQIYDNIIRTRCCCGSNFHYWKSTEIDKHGLRYFQPLRLYSVNTREAALSQGRQDWWQHYDNLSHIWWMFGISDWGEGISLSGSGSLDRMMRKISQHLHWGLREHFAEFSQTELERREERLRRDGSFICQR